VNDLAPEVLKQLQQNNKAAFAQLVDKYQRAVYNLCYRMLGNPEEAEDISQETFLRVYRNIAKYDEKRSFSTWLLSISAHLCIDQLRKRRMAIISIDSAPENEPADGSPSPEAMFYRKENQQQIQGLLKTLNPQDRAAVVMYYWYDFSYEEIALSLSMSSSAVKSRLHRARISLAQAFSKQNGENYVPERKTNESPAL